MGTIGIRLEDLPLRAQQQALAQLKTAQIQKARKYRNEPEMAEGIRFDRKKEAGRFRELQAMLQAGLIRELRLQQDFTLQEAYTTPDGRRIRAIRYCADFCYERKTQTGWEKIVEDVKSRATRTQKYIIHGDGDVHPPTEEIPRRQLPGARRRHPRELRRRMRQTTA